MFEYIVGGVELMFNCRLGTAVKIQKKFKKSVSVLMSDIDKMNTTDLIALLYTGIDESEMNYNEFMDLLLDNIGMGELYDMIKKFTYKLQYPDLDFDEIEAKLLDNRKEAEELEKNL